MSELKKFQVQTARPLPIIVLADTSGSMSVDGKIEALNKSLKDMISSFAGESRLRAELQVSLITFGSQAGGCGRFLGRFIRTSIRPHDDTRWDYARQ
ncbi:vWA domain-containing protein, partial [Pseudomonas aeruginosa]